MLSIVSLDVDSHYEGEYACSVQNEYGRDSISYSLNILQVPEAPNLSVTSTTTSSITLSWSKVANKLAVLEFIVIFRKVSDNSQQRIVDGNRDGTIIDNLLCGTQYELQIQAKNQIGTGPLSSVIRAMTRGSGKKISSIHFIQIIRCCFIFVNYANIHACRSASSQCQYAIQLGTKCAICTDSPLGSLADRRMQDQ